MEKKEDYVSLAKRLEMLLEKIEKYELEENRVKFEQVKREILDIQEMI